MRARTPASRLLSAEQDETISTGQNAGGIPMIRTTKPFLSLTAADLMTRALSVIPQEMSLRAAAHLLAQGRVTGAPVIDGQGHLVGVLSATDFVHWVENDEFAPVERRGHGECICSDWQVADVELLPADQVSVHMTRDVV